MKILKYYNEFLNESKEFLTTESEIKGITPKELEMINKLKTIVKKTVLDGKQGGGHIYLKIPVQIGTRSGKPVYCNSFYLHDNNHYNEDHLVFNILYNETHKYPKLYDRDWDFNLVNYQDIKNGFVNSSKLKKSGQFQKPMNYKFQFDLDFIEKIYDSASKLDDNWIKFCDDFQQEHHDWIRLSHKKDSKIDWERQIRHKKSEIESERLMNFHEPIFQIKELEEMERDGEEVYREKIRKQNDWMEEYFKKLESDEDSWLSKMKKKNK